MREFVGIACMALVIVCLPLGIFLMCVGVFRLIREHRAAAQAAKEKP